MSVSFRDSDSEKRTDVQLGFDLDLSVVQRDNVLGESQPDSDTLLRRIVVPGLVEPLEDPGLFIHGYSDSVVLHGNGCRLLLLFVGKMHLSDTSPAVFERIVEQVDDDDFHFSAVDPEHERCVGNLYREPNPEVIGQRFEQFGYDAEEFRHVGLYGRELHLVVFVFAQVEDLLQQGR